MGKTIGVYVGLIWIYLTLLYKRGSVGIVSLLAANVLFCIVLDGSILKIIKGYCFISIFMGFFIDYRKERLLFKIFNISGFSQIIAKTSIITTLGLIQWLVFLFMQK
jgi:hypothetical protein